MNYINYKKDKVINFWKNIRLLKFASPYVAGIPLILCTLPIFTKNYRG